MNIRKHTLVFAAATLVLSALCVAWLPAGEPVLAGHESPVRTAPLLSRTCAVVPATPPPCATP